MTEEEKEEVKRDLDKAVKISARIAENMIHSIEKKLKREDNIPRLTAMILQYTTSMLLASSISMHRNVAKLNEETIKNMLSKTIADALGMANSGAIKAESVREH